ncbi:MAG: thioredoxin domain-containing protein [Patescibacteria group bacterium]
MSLSNKQLFAIFLPALLLVVFGVFVQIVRYAPTDPEEYLNESPADILNIPIFNDDPIIGRKDAATTLVAFADVGCTHCKEQFAQFQTLTSEYPKKIKIIWKGLPVTRLPYPSDRANLYAYCANEQGDFVAFVRTLIADGESFTTEEVLQTTAKTAELNTRELDRCLASGRPEVYQQKIESLARDLNIQTVPTIFLSNAQIQAPTTIEGWKAVLKL